MTSGVCIMYAFNQKVTADGRRRVDLIDRFGSIIRNAYIMSGVGLPMSVPLESEIPISDYQKYPRVVVGSMSGEVLPIVLGALDNEDLTYTTETSPETNYDESDPDDSRLTNAADVDIPENVAGMEEVALASPRGGRLLLKHNGHAVLAGVGISMQIPSGSYVRVSAGGDTTGRVPLVEPLLRVIENMARTINALQDEVRALRLTLTGPFDLTLVGLAPTPSGAVVAGPGVLQVTALTTSVGQSTSTDLQPVDPLTISSATLRISSATEV